MPYNNKRNCFVYRKNNYINFQVLNEILLSNTIGNKYKEGIFECNYDLSYFLRLSKDITAIPDEITEYKFKCILLTLHHLKGVENKHLVKFFWALMYKTCNIRANKYKRRLFKFEEIFDPEFSSLIDFYIKHNLVRAFLNNYMMKYICCDGNIVLLDNDNESFDNSLFDEKIPYKNLLINNYKVFCKLENILRNPNTLNCFQTLLNELNMKSLIINDYKARETSDINTDFYIFSMHVYKSIIIVDFVRTHSSLFLNRVNDLIERNIEYLSLLNFIVYRAELISILNKPKLKGLVLNYVNTLENIDFVEDFIEFSKTLEYIDFREIGIYFTWWYNIFETTNIRKIILSFSNLFTQKKFIIEFCRIELYKNILYLEIMFCNVGINTEFFVSLAHFKSLQTFKVSRFKTTPTTEALLSKAIVGMNNLVCLSIQQYSISSNFYNNLFKMQQIKFLNLINFDLGKYILRISFFPEYTSVIRINLMSMNISRASLKEIFKLENLIDLRLKCCFFQPFSDPNFTIFMSRNIRALDFYGANLKDIKCVSILNNLSCVESLDLSDTGLPPGYLVNLSSNCNLSLRSLSYELNILDKNDLSRIEKLVVLEELKLSKCKLLGCSFSEIGDFCGFFNSLINLDLEFVEIKIEDFQYFKRFKHLKKLRCRHFGFDLDVLKCFFVSSNINKFSTDNIDEETFNSSLGKILYEKNIDILD
ncbi:hypothetical protein CWI38_0341p0030 [Hamiltosporidium tvaerminnensis]|uniref:Leucine-rich repeat-containing protein n=1 Tax=Hamiltosporidium tvaerminnensis TaxID=1176355 RepID=A0A4Q9M0N9_9MICR|nr:hypothetical protein CWI38_0341p0030 [Hamiltosporidium tvaerminnensis]